jgi:hypothetical protein
MYGAAQGDLHYSLPYVKEALKYSSALGAVPRPENWGLTSEER